MKNLKNLYDEILIRTKISLKKSIDGGAQIVYIDN